MRLPPQFSGLTALAVLATAPTWARPRILPAEDDLAAAAELLNAGSRVALLVGGSLLAILIACGIGWLYRPRQRLDPLLQLYQIQH
mgnify:CR=1 FL=1